MFLLKKRHTQNLLLKNMFLEFEFELLRYATYIARVKDTHISAGINQELKTTHSNITIILQNTKYIISLSSVYYPFIIFSVYHIMNLQSGIWCI